MIKVDTWKCWIMKQVLTKFGSIKIDNGGDAIMTSDAIYYHTTYSKSSSIYIVIRIHHCISTVINFETTKFCDNLLRDSIPQYIKSTMVWPSFYKWLYLWNVNSLECTVCECSHGNFPIILSTENACTAIRVMYRKCILDGIPSVEYRCSFFLDSYPTVFCTVKQIGKH